MMNISSGVPWASVLGPFFIYINNLPKVQLYMFADDTKLYHTITSESDCDILQ